MMAAYVLDHKQRCAQRQLPFWPPCLTCGFSTTNQCMGRAPYEMRNNKNDVRQDEHGLTVQCGLPVCIDCEQQFGRCKVCERGNVIRYDSLPTEWARLGGVTTELIQE